MEGAFRKWIVASCNRRFVGRSAGDSFSVHENCMSDVLLLKQQLIDCVETKLSESSKTHHCINKARPRIHLQQFNL